MMETMQSAPPRPAARDFAGLTLLTLGTVAMLAAIAVTMRFNFLYGYGLGQSSESAWLFGWANVFVDCWKVLSGIFATLLWRRGRKAAAIAAAIIWFVALLWACNSAVGVGLKDRALAATGRERVRLTYDETVQQLGQTERRRAAIGNIHSAAEITATIESELAKPVMSGGRISGTVGSLSSACSKTDKRTANACADVAKLRETHAAAVEHARLGDEIERLRQRVATLRGEGALAARDAHEDFLARISARWLGVANIPAAISIFFALVLELISALAPVVVSAYADAGQGRVRAAAPSEEVDMPGNGDSRINVGLAEHIETFIVEQTRPAPESVSTEVDAIFADYAEWCAANNEIPLLRAEFTQAVDCYFSGSAHGLIVRRQASRYVGLQLVAVPK